MQVKRTRSEGCLSLTPSRRGSAFPFLWPLFSHSMQRVHQTQECSDSLSSKALGFFPLVEKTFLLLPSLFFGLVGCLFLAARSILNSQARDQVKGTVATYAAPVAMPDP